VRPGTLKMMSQFAMLTRLKEPENSSLYSKMLIYDGENLEGHRPARQELPGVPRLRRRRRGHERDLDPLRVQDPLQGLQLRPGRGRRQPGAPDVRARAADRARAVPAELEQKYLGFIKEHLSARYAEFIGKEIQTAYLESYSEYGQNIFDRYVTYADYWIQDQEYRDTDTGEVFDRSQLNAELEKIEKPAGISNPKDFRNEIVNFVLRARANNNGKNPLWTSYEKLRTVIEKKMFSNTEELLPVISFNAKASADEAKKHENFVNRMVEKGYTPKQVRLLCEWYLRVEECELRLLTGRPMLQQIIDRRLAGKNKSIGNRERFLRRYQAQVREAVRRAIDKRGIREIEQGEDMHLPKRDISEPTFGHGSGGAREIVHPGNKEYVRGDHIERPQGGSGAAAASGKAGDSGEGEDDFVFHLTKEEFMQIFFDDLALPRLVRSQLVEMPEMKSQRAGYSSTRHAEQPERDPIDARRDRPPGRDRLRLARRAAALLAKLAELPEGLADPPSSWRARRSRRRSRPAAPARAHPLSRPDRPALSATGCACRSDRQGGDVLPDGRLGLDGRRRGRTSPSASSSCSTCS
jgi:hypothetical protein